MNKKIQNFTDISAWKHAHALRIDVLKIIRDFPQAYQFGLSAQMQRCSISVGSNIAEGFGRSSLKERVRFLVIAKASLIELQDQIIVAKDLELVNKKVFDKLVEQSITTHKILNGLIRSTRTLDSRIKPQDSKS